MFKSLIACEIGPNYTIDDGLIALKLIFKLPFKRCLNTDVFDLMNNFFPNNQLIGFTDSGRTALTLLLNSLNLPTNSEVLIQGFSCIVVPNSVRQSGLKPVICDINEKNFNLDIDDAMKKITFKTRVLIIQYPFGMIPNIDKIISFCSQHNLILIEDCAHVFNEKVWVNGVERFIGTLGYGSVFSFGRDKVISSTVGGGFVLNSGTKDQIEFLEKQLSLLPSMSKLKEFQAIAYCILSVFLIRPFYFYGLGKFILVISRTTRLIGEIYSEQEKKGISINANQSQYSSLLSILVLNQLKKIHTFQDHRRTISTIYSSILLTENYNHKNLLRFPLIVPQHKYKIIKEILRNHQVLIGTWYNSIFIPQEVNLEDLGYCEGSLPICEKLIQSRVLNLPTNINVSEQKAKKIVGLIKPLLT